MRVLKTIIGAMTSGVMLTACAHDKNSMGMNPEEAAVPAPVLTVITRQNPETQLMALILTKAAVDRGSPARILLYDKGGDLALKVPPKLSQKQLAPKSMSPVGLLSKLLDSGVRVDVCAIYLPNRELGAEALVKHVGVATPADISAYYTQDGAKILSF